jgi:2,5-diketo-D-gluconate reductase A
MNVESTVTLRGGRKMPVLGLGTWQLTRDTADTVARAVDLGFRLIDTSGDYGTQPGVGEAIRSSGVDRGELYIVTKVEETDDAYEGTRVDLEELGLEYADLMLIHRPPDDGPGIELWQGLIRARQDGLAKDIGVSNYTARQIAALEQATGETPAVNQIEWSPFGHSDAMLEFCAERGICIQAYSPLTRTKRLTDDTLTEIAEAHGKTPAQVLIRWNLQRGTVPLPKANREEHLAENIHVFDFELDAAEMRRLNDLNEQYSSLGKLPYA